ncbi:hypothetical protein KM043_010515 [Ampulex compressa]|nr:hypothetical protein KM043_010515 [Ampulex compressa]
MCRRGFSIRKSSFLVRKGGRERPRRDRRKAAGSDGEESEESEEAGRSRGARRERESVGEKKAKGERRLSAKEGRVGGFGEPLDGARAPNGPSRHENRFVLFDTKRYVSPYGRGSSWRVT